jgi:hypothetical protein
MPNFNTIFLEAPLIAGKAPCMYNGYIYSKDDVRSPFVKPPWRTWRLRNKKYLSKRKIQNMRNPPTPIHRIQWKFVQSMWSRLDWNIVERVILRPDLDKEPDRSKQSFGRKILLLKLFSKLIHAPKCLKKCIYAILYCIHWLYIKKGNIQPFLETRFWVRPGPSTVLWR